MRFTSQDERLTWLKNTAKAIRKLEEQRFRAVMDRNFGRAYSLLKGIKFAQAEFRKQSRLFGKAGL